jgi:hypothetical protein
MEIDRESMGTKFRNCGHFYGALAAVCTAVLPVAADAQDAAADRIEAIERKIHGLEGEFGPTRNVASCARAAARLDGNSRHDCSF